MSLHLRAGDLMFFVDPEGEREENLLVSPRRRDVFLRHVGSSSGCTVVLGCGNSGCPDQLSVDAGPVRRLPLRIAHVYWFRDGERDAWLGNTEPNKDNPSTPWMETLVALNLTAGEHILEFSAKYLSGKASLKLACLSGEVSYVVVNATANENFWSRELVDWQFNRVDSIPGDFVVRPLVLLEDGKWYVEANISD